MRLPLDDIRARIAFAEWSADQVSALRKLGFQVADKLTARVLVELHNRGAFAGGLVLVGTLGYMAWLNELGVMAVSARTLDVDLARRQPLKLAAPLPFLDTMKATGLPFVAVPGLPSSSPSTLDQTAGRRGPASGCACPRADAGSAYSRARARLGGAGNSSLRLPAGRCRAGSNAGRRTLHSVAPAQAARLVWHKLYAATQRHGAPEKAAKDTQQALVLGAVLADDDPSLLIQAFDAAPAGMLAPIRRLKERFDCAVIRPSRMGGHPGPLFERLMPDGFSELRARQR
jgi:hypothetical protein